MRTLIKSAIHIVIITVAVILFTIVPSMLKNKQLKDWPTVEGKVIYSLVYTENDPFRTKYYPMIKYSYTVNNQEYTHLANRYKGGHKRGGFHKKANAAQKIANFPDGAKITVHYNPKNPSKSTIVY